MAQEPENLVLEYLRKLDRKVDGLITEFRQFNLRVATTESHVASLHIADVQQGGEIDRIKVRLDRIESRLELSER